MVRQCIYCNETIHQENEGLVCFRCKPHNLGVKHEIYDNEKYEDSQDTFSNVYLGNINYRRMRQRMLDSQDEC